MVWGYFDFTFQEFKILALAALNSSSVRIPFSFNAASFSSSSDIDETSKLGSSVIIFSTAFGLGGIFLEFLFLEKSSLIFNFAISEFDSSSPFFMFFLTAPNQVFP